MPRKSPECCKEDTHSSNLIQSHLTRHSCPLTLVACPTRHSLVQHNCTHNRICHPSLTAAVPHLLTCRPMDHSTRATVQTTQGMLEVQHTLNLQPPVGTCQRQSNPNHTPPSWGHTVTQALRPSPAIYLRMTFDPTAEISAVGSKVMRKSCARRTESLGRGDEASVFVVSCEPCVGLARAH